MLIATPTHSLLRVIAQTLHLLDVILAYFVLGWRCAEALFLFSYLEVVVLVLLLLHILYALTLFLLGGLVRLAAMARPPEVAKN